MTEQAQLSKSVGLDSRNKPCECTGLSITGNGKQQQTG